MPITINTQSYVHKEEYNFARTFAYEGIKPNYQGELKLDFSEIKTIMKTPTRLSNTIEVRLLLGPYYKMKKGNFNSSTIKWKSNDTPFPAIYRKFTIVQKIKLPNNIPKMKKIISSENNLNIEGIKIYHGRITVNFILNSTIIFIPK